ncbi:polar amino acid transport system permease protein [Mycoplana sp. BE70]|uniref:amino acid ABC transporter permease n=1 Tax=Mycoplana sp. BE70 TaxID=2817775 RepID=UPI00285B2FEC|nr:amino acid ABC transporter permease [Mycoplana sp. BE70]MDR6757087.1 polar amino acid transport system permease protein [Mycoplana sp. BE70]
MPQPNPKSSAALSLSDLPGPEVPIRGLRHPGRWISGGLVILLLAVIGRAFAVGQIQWTVVGEFLTAGVIITGFGWTLLISGCALVLGVALGFAFGIMRLSENPILRLAAWLYVWVFRGTPVLLQLLIWFNIALVFPRLYIPGLVDERMVDVVTPFVAAVLGLGVNEGSYLTEVVRGGITSVDRGQKEAAHTLGMTPGQTMRRIILPQTLRLILPVLGNSANGMLKFSSLAATIAMGEMLNAAQRIYFINGAVIELLFVCAIWYLAGTTVLSIGQYYLERHFGRDAEAAVSKSSWFKGWAARRAVASEEA